MKKKANKDVKETVEVIGQVGGLAQGFLEKLILDAVEKVLHARQHDLIKKPLPMEETIRPVPLPVEKKERDEAEDLDVHLSVSSKLESRKRAFIRRINEAFSNYVLFSIGDSLHNAELDQEALGIKHLIFGSKKVTLSVNHTPIADSFMRRGNAIERRVWVNFIVDIFEPLPAEKAGMSVEDQFRRYQGWIGARADFYRSHDILYITHFYTSVIEDEIRGIN